MKWIKGLPPIHKVSIQYLFKARVFSDKNEKLYWDKYFVANPTDSELEKYNANYIWYFDFIKNLGE